MKITIYGTENCSRCSKLESLAKEVVEEESIEAEVEKVNDPAEAAKMGIMSLPALAVDGKLKAKGKVSTKEEIKKYLNV
jgi:small redox-active disulfide protein 2